jgi:hypothetical protein
VSRIASQASWNINSDEDSIFDGTQPKSNKTPTTTNKTPTTTNKTPTITNKTPTTNNKAPTATNKTPTTTNKAPTATNKTPTATNKTATATATNETPTTANNNPATGDKTPASTNRTTTNLEESTAIGIAFNADLIAEYRTRLKAIYDKGRKGEFSKVTFRYTRTGKSKDYSEALSFYDGQLEYEDRPSEDVLLPFTCMIYYCKKKLTIVKFHIGKFNLSTSINRFYFIC